ncbi:hypothetical protein PAECIP111893_00296 [Paenibacillus plantiphilus]|uniref:Uncharacterized protein n=2 Tax=Paenibacillus plantiphilus TaxID=2905650 RepID=A0ABN8FX50_9BACL|nr:hypothetical protein PAECIP111893_00296 [Paenibacillus plantiphilus]
MEIEIPAHLQRDRYWGALLYLFINTPKLQLYFTPGYVCLKSERVFGTKLKKVSAPWSQSEKFMLKLALHCFNERNKVDLSDMDYLDSNHRQIAFTALKLRYGR